MSTLDNTFWESRFQANTTPWERGEINPAFTRWRASGALEPCSIIIPGAGRSPEPLALHTAGFEVTALDLAPSAVAFQGEILGQNRAVLGDVTQWLPQNPVDAVYDQTCLCALPPVLWPAYEAQLWHWLRPGGRLFVLFMQTGREGGPPFHCDLAAMQTLFDRWQWPESTDADSPHRVGTERPRILIRP